MTVADRPIVRLDADVADELFDALRYSGKTPEKHRQSFIRNATSGEPAVRVHIGGFDATLALEGGVWFVYPADSRTAHNRHVKAVIDKVNRVLEDIFAKFN